MSTAMLSAAAAAAMVAVDVEAATATFHHSQRRSAETTVQHKGS